MGIKRKTQYWEIGRVNVNVAPLPSALFSAHIFPPCASTMPLEINRPNPEPVPD